MRDIYGLFSNFDVNQKIFIERFQAKLVRMDLGGKGKDIKALIIDLRFIIIIIIILIIIFRLFTIETTGW